MPTPLTLIAPDLNPVPGDNAADTAHWPTLARLAGRGTVAPRALDARADARQAAGRDALNPHSAAGKYPRAAVMLAGSTNERAAGFWLRMQPMHFIAGLDRITTVVLRGAGRMTAAERSSLDSVFAEHL